MVILEEHLCETLCAQPFSANVGACYVIVDLILRSTKKNLGKHFKNCKKLGTKSQLSTPI